MRVHRFAFAIVTAVVLLAGCGGGDDDGNPMNTGPRAESIALSAGNNQAVGIGIAVPIAPAVIVRDQNGQPFAGAIVTFAVESGGGSVAGAVDTTGADGIARVGSWTLGSTPGVNMLLATAPGLSGSPVRFTAAATSQVATTMLVLEGNNQTAPAASAVPIAPAVVVLDDEQQAFAGAVVTFSVLSGDGGITDAVDTTGSDGVAHVGSWTLGEAPGTNQLRVMAQGIATPIDFTATGILIPSTIAASEGDAQTAEVGMAVAIAPAVIVRDQFAAPFAGAAVTFSVETGGGMITAATDTTDSAGVARVGSWTLGAAAGPNTLLATASGVSGSPVLFTATATASTRAEWTVMVFLAADNNLAIAGVQDIDEMEAAGFDPRVRVVVQAEFSPQQLDLVNATAADINRPNFNTFRYSVEGQGPDVHGPNGAAEDIGNRDMTDPAELREFIEWAKKNYPADRYALVLWNHGGGYQGLLQDVTSAGNALMPLDDLPAALDASAPLDLIDFDMCLMGAYETLEQINGFADFAVFSEEVVPGEGNPYREIIDGIQENPSAEPPAVATIFVERFHASFQGDQASTTKSAYELAAYSSFVSNLDVLAASLRANLPALSSAIGLASTNAQAFEYPYLKDCVDFLTNLRSLVGNAALDAQIDAVIADATGSFRIANAARTGTGSAVGGGASNVDDANGLSILMPSGGESDRLPDSGPGSFAVYEASFGGREWTLFLSDWLQGEAATAYLDQGDTPFECYLLWAEEAVAAGADIDIWVFEPNGNLFIPYLGTVTPNGTLTNDSYEDDTFYEGYLTNRFAEGGTYLFFANLFSDPLEFRPFYDLVYRNGPNSDFVSSFDPDYPQMSKDASWLDDPTPTPEEIGLGAYSDLQLAGVFEISAGVAGKKVASMSRGAAGAAADVRRLTREQLDVVRARQKARELAARRTDASAATTRRAVESSGASAVLRRTAARLATVR